MPAPLTTGDDVLVTLNLYENGAAIPLTGGSVRACLQNGAGVPLSQTVAQSSSESGADWANGVLVVRIPKEQHWLTRGNAWLEIEYTPSGGTARTFPLVQYEVQAGVMS